ncbi:hypothetical protein [Luteitalea pratensis]|uniref:hypothetical protein n=1 Tax=Luteitalea pratensis TaxID=1855912 RepID=UPI0012FF8C39|nr:hypothetical protein [Luteitalea pratensis]
MIDQRWSGPRAYIGQYGNGCRVPGTGNRKWAVGWDWGLAWFAFDIPGIRGMAALRGLSYGRS